MYLAFVGKTTYLSLCTAHHHPLLTQIVERDQRLRFLPCEPQK